MLLLLVGNGDACQECIFWNFIDLNGRLMKRSDQRALKCHIKIKFKDFKFSVSDAENHPHKKKSYCNYLKTNPFYKLKIHFVQKVLNQKHDA